MNAGVETKVPSLPAPADLGTRARWATRLPGLFYPFAAAVNLLLLFIGFSAFFLHGRGEANRIISPSMMALDFVHGVSITAWYVLLLVQAILVRSGARRLHMNLGWISVALVPLVTTFCVLTALHSVREMPDRIVFQLPPLQFLRLMLTQAAVFSLCATAAILLRKRSHLHGPLMLMASVSVLGGATSRIPWLNDVFGGYVPSGYFGPVFAWGAILTMLGSLRRGRLDRPLAAGYILIVISNLIAVI